MLLYDANLSPHLVTHLSDIFPDAEHTLTLGIAWSDKLVWETALQKNLIILTKDNDFNKILEETGFPPKIIQIRRGNCNTSTIVAMLKENRESIYSSAKNPEAGIVYLK